MHKIPTRHGLTIGELAYKINESMVYKAILDTDHIGKVLPNDCKKLIAIKKSF